MKVYRSACLLWLLLASLGAAAQVPASGASQQKQVYAFLGHYFRQLSANSSHAYRLAVEVVPVVSPYANHFDLRRALSADYLTVNQFVTRVRVDSLLTAADFDAMRAQLAAWQSVRRWRTGPLRAAGVAVLPPDRRTQPQRLFPDFTTYRVFPPLFSRNGQLALFYVENYCGLDCAGGQFNLLRRQPDGSWKFVLGVPIFVS